MSQTVPQNVACHADAFLIPLSAERRLPTDAAQPLRGPRREQRARSLRTVIALAGLALAGCAGGPSSTPSYPAPYRAELSLCAGVVVSNAPAADSYRRIAGYTPFAFIRGIRLARAPLDACVSSAFGPRRGGAGSIHEGLDLFTRTPRQAFSGGPGRVAYVGENPGWGLNILIDHGAGVATRYAHLSSAAVRRGDQVGDGALVGMTGKSGNATAVHLHYEILVDGRPVDPLRAGD